MPTNYSSIIQANIPILTCQPDQTHSSNLFRIIKSTLWVDTDCDILHINTDALPIELHMYFNDITDIPDEELLVALQGM